MREKTIELIKQYSGIDIIKNDMNLRDDLNLDSFDIVLILIEIDSIFNVNIDPEEVDTVGDLIQLVDKYEKINLT